MNKFFDMDSDMDEVIDVVDMDELDPEFDEMDELDKQMVEYYGGWENYEWCNECEERVWLHSNYGNRVDYGDLNFD